MDKETALDLIQAVRDALRLLATHDHDGTECGGEVTGLLDCERELERIGTRLDAIKARIEMRPG